jgi:hypothetical protein
LAVADSRSDSITASIRGVAHDFNNILMAISGYAEFAKRLRL